MENRSITFLITAFVLLIIGISLIVPVSDIILGVTDTTAITNEAIDISSARVDGDDINESVEFTIANAPTGWKSNDCPLTDVVYGNSSDDYTLTTDYLMTLSTGVLKLKNTTTVIGGPNDTLIDYNYCTDDYLNAGWQRTVLDLVPGFFALALLLASIALFYNVAKAEGILGL